MHRLQRGYTAVAMGILGTEVIVIPRAALQAVLPAPTLEALRKRITSQQTRLGMSNTSNTEKVGGLGQLLPDIQATWHATAHRSAQHTGHSFCISTTTATFDHSFHIQRATRWPEDAEALREILRLAPGTRTTWQVSAGGCSQGGASCHCVERRAGCESAGQGRHLCAAMLALPPLFTARADCTACTADRGAG